MRDHSHVTRAWSPISRCRVERWRSGSCTWQDIADIAHLAQQVWDKGLLYAVALDPYGVGAIVDALDEVGITGQEQIVGISQGWKLTGAIKTAERKLADGSLRHSGQRLMSWAVANARVEAKGNASPSRPRVAPRSIR
jgi:phage terminase large subunit-like protein